MNVLDIALGVIIGIVASWLLGFLLVDKETMQELESEFRSSSSEEK